MAASPAFPKTPTPDIGFIPAYADPVPWVRAQRRGCPETREQSECAKRWMWKHSAGRAQNLWGLLLQMLTHGLIQLQHVMVMQAVKDLTALLAVADEPSGPQRTELVGDGGLRHPERLRQIADAELIRRQQRDEPQPRGISQDGEELPHALRLLRGERREFCRRVIRGRVMLGADIGLIVGVSGAAFHGSGHSREIARNGN